MIVVYRLNPLLWHGVARWVIKTKKIALVNILAGNVDLVPEFVPWHGSVRAGCGVGDCDAARAVETSRSTQTPG